MRRACRTALVALLALAVAGCGSPSAETAPPPTAPPPSTTASPTPAPTATETPIPPTATVVPTRPPCQSRYGCAAGVGETMPCARTSR